MPNPRVLSLPSQDELKCLFTYVPETGHLIWNVRPESDFALKRAHTAWNTRYANRRAGFMFRGYRKIASGTKSLAEHRIIWVMMNGPIPDGMQIDHINGIPSDNRLENLRVVTPSENGRNMKIAANNKSGFSGVYWSTQYQRWLASVTVNGVKAHLGHFNSKEVAYEAVRAFRAANGFTERHGTALSGTLNCLTSAAP